MKKLITIFLSSLLTSGCAFSSGIGYSIHGQRYYYPVHSNFQHQYREEQYRRQLRRQSEELEELRLQEQIRYNDELIYRERLRLEYQK